jgi:hypothetical protein
MVAAAASTLYLSRRSAAKADDRRILTGCSVKKMGTHRLKKLKSPTRPQSDLDLLSLRLATRRSQHFKGNAVVILSQLAWRLKRLITSHRSPITSHFRHTQCPAPSIQPPTPSAVSTISTAREQRMSPITRTRTDAPWRPITRRMPSEQSSRI